ncbi:MAG: chromosomal replication initiator protein DnaA [Candidatus Pacebacteria bacterium]|nr:chromosomal replication initiator protein DnaA [Candidatus Paceibacterota bacterium]
MENNNLWQAVLAQIQFTTSEANFATWFKNTKILSGKKGVLTVSVPNSFVKDWLENKYDKPILKIINSLDKEIRKIDFVVSKTLSHIDKISFQPKETEQLELGVFQKNQKTGLNIRYTFENLVVASFNELAHAAAIAVSENPGTVYNPLFIYGKVGLGKTHLLQAIGNSVSESPLKKEIKYIPAERFVSTVISAIRNGTIEKFKKDYKKIDVLILDDIQFLAGKEKTQEEFFHIFNALYQKNKQIILSSDRPPKSISALAERLRSRFEGGMIADISLPELETRMAILKSKAQEKKSEFSEEIYNLIATSIQSNIRELEGALNRIILHQKMYNKKIVEKEAKAILKEITFAPMQKITPKKIIQLVADFYDLKEKQLLSSSRKKEIVRPRQIAMYILRTKLKNSYPFIADKFGGKDHTTAIYACKKIKSELERNENLEKEINMINIRLTNS